MCNTELFIFTKKKNNKQTCLIVHLPAYTILGVFSLLSSCFSVKKKAIHHSSNVSI